MSKLTLSAIFLAAATALTSCDGSEAPARAKSKGVEFGKQDDLMHRMELATLSEPVTDIYSYPIEGEGQFATVVTDSGGIRTNLFLETAAAYAFMMDRLKDKGKDFHLDAITLQEHTCLGDGVPNLYSYFVKMHHGEKPAPALVRKNDTKTNAIELAHYRTYGSVFTASSSVCNTQDGDGRIPSLVQVRADQKGFMAYSKVQDGVDLVRTHENLYHLKTDSIVRASVTAKGAFSQNPNAYIVYMSSDPTKTDTTAVKPVITDTLAHH